MKVCDMCRDPEDQPILRASIHVRGVSSGAFDIGERCLDRVKEARNPAKSRAALRRVAKGEAWTPREPVEPLMRFEEWEQLHDARSVAGSASEDTP